MGSGMGAAEQEERMERKKVKGRGRGDRRKRAAGSSEQGGWDLEKLGPVGGLTAAAAVALGEPLRSRLPEVGKDQRTPTNWGLGCV